MPNLVDISRDVVSRTPEGQAALIALMAVQHWKAYPAIRRAHGNLGAYFDVLVELHAAGAIKLKGEHFVDTKEISGVEHGSRLHQKWIAAGRPGAFSDYIKAEEKRELWNNNPMLKKQFPDYEKYVEHIKKGGSK
jgi:hypothetical protein